MIGTDGLIVKDILALGAGKRLKGLTDSKGHSGFGNGFGHVNSKELSGFGGKLMLVILLIIRDILALGP